MCVRCHFFCQKTVCFLCVTVSFNLLCELVSFFSFLVCICSLVYFSFIGDFFSSFLLRMIIKFVKITTTADIVVFVVFFCYILFLYISCVVVGIWSACMVNIFHKYQLTNKKTAEKKEFLCFNDWDCRSQSNAKMCDKRTGGANKCIGRKWLRWILAK